MIQRPYHNFILTLNIMAGINTFRIPNMWTASASLAPNNVLSRESIVSDGFLDLDSGASIDYSQSDSQPGPDDYGPAFWV
jgi:hypothetical protein